MILNLYVYRNIDRYENQRQRFIQTNKKGGELIVIIASWYTLFIFKVAVNIFHCLPSSSKLFAAIKHLLTSLKLHAFMLKTTFRQEIPVAKDKTKKKSNTRFSRIA